MPYWMTHPDHGLNPVYDIGQLERDKKQGWSLLNQGENPVFEKPAAPAVDSVEPDAPTDILSGVVVDILPQLPGKTLAELEDMHTRESDGKARKGLMTALAEEIESRKG